MTGCTTRSLNTGLLKWASLDFDDLAVLRNTPPFVSPEMGPINFLRRTSRFERTLVRTPYAIESVTVLGWADIKCEETPRHSGGG